jgi:NAD(P)-dependent dehydrogenase (short-subunit alcohol dehydrogenase family)
MGTALITGAASLIGEGIARALAGDGWNLALTDINVAGAEAVAGRLNASTRVEVSGMDVTDHGQVKTVVGETARAFGSIDALVNCAGGLRGLGITRKAVADIPPEDWRRIIDTNLKGMLNAVHCTLPVMKAQGAGAIVSIAGRDPTTARRRRHSADRPPRTMSAARCAGCSRPRHPTSPVPASTSQAAPHCIERGHTLGL